MPYKLIFLVFLVFSFYESVAAQTSEALIEHPYFWKVEKDGKIYLLNEKIRQFRYHFH